MSSTFHIQETSKSIQRMFKDFEKKTLPTYTVEQIEKAVESGALFFNEASMLKALVDIKKSNFTDESLLNQVKLIKPIAVQKADGEPIKVGYILEKE